MKAEPRQHETVIEFEASVEEVWRAITDAREMERWFAPKMTVTPGVGGELVADWGPGLVWRTVIETWEPGRRLVLSEVRDRVMSAAEEPEMLEPMRLVQDYTLEAREGKTVLRLVHSGFGSGGGWDTEYDGTKGGWKMCFERMRVAIEQHRGETVSNSILSLMVPGLNADSVLDAIAALKPDGCEIEQREGSHMTIVLNEDHASSLGISAQPVAGGTMAYLEFLLYAVNGERERELRSQWREIVGRIV